MARKTGLAFFVVLFAGIAVVAYSFLQWQSFVDTPASVTEAAGTRDSRSDEFPAMDQLAFEDPSDDPHVHYNLGLALQSQGKRTEAIREYRKTLEIDDSHVEAHNNLAAALAASDELDEALDHFRRVVELKPNYAEGYCNLGNALVAQGKYDEAIGHYRRAIELKRDYSKAYNNLAVALKQTGRLEEAYRYMQEARRLDRTHEPSRLTAAARDDASYTDRWLSDEPLTIIKTARGQDIHRSQEAQLDPAQDGWESEVLAEQAQSRLDGMLRVLVTGSLGDRALTDNVSPKFACGRLRPAKLNEVFRDASIVVRRPSEVDHESATTHIGAQGLTDALAEWARPLTGASDIQVHVKVVRLNETSATIGTLVVVEASGRTPSGCVEQHATWDCQWVRESESLRLSSIHVRDYEESIGTSPAGVWFSDCTESVLNENPSFNEQLLYGLNHWLSRIGRVQGIHVFARWGIAVGDCNADGLDDIYVCQPGGLPNRLYVQNEDGTATDVSQHAGVDWLDHTSSALFVDLDNDGDQDLTVATMSGLLVMENDSTGRFRSRATLSTVDVDLQSLSAADYDNDGDLDLYVCVDFANGQSLRDERSVGFVYHNANDGGANVLFRNDIVASEGGKWQFTDVTRETGLDEHNRRHSLAAAWEDYDNDGDQDLYVANDYGQNCLYRNDGNRFNEVAAAAEVVDFGSGMSVSWADYNRDGWMDLYVGNMFSSAGNRVTRQAAFTAFADESVRAIYSRFAKGNSLFENSGEDRRPSGVGFREVGAEAAVEMARWAWSSVFADLNNDGWEDLIVANGYITAEDTGDL